MFHRKKNAQKIPENSLSLRLIILAAMLTPLLALARTRIDLLPHALAASILVGLGHWYSYRQRTKPSQLVRGLLFMGINLALCGMFAGLMWGGTVPQAQFAIFTQGITSFDLRYRNSLFNTLIHSLAILYVTATLSRTTELALYLLLFGGLALAAFFTAERAAGLASVRLTPAIVNPARRPLTLFSLAFGTMALVVVVILFLFTPRFANRPIVPPFSLNLPLRGNTTAEIINPGVPVVQVNGWSNDSSDYYYGFDTSLDLRYRGGLSNEIVMYVRSPSRSYWRSHSYDQYDGLTWQQGERTLVDLERAGIYFELPVPLGSPQSQTKSAELGEDGHRHLHDDPGMPRHLQEILNEDIPAKESWRKDQQIVQTFNLVREQPNLVFAAYRPAEIFITTEQVSLDQGDGIRLPEPLQAGMTYSVVSYRPDFNPAALRLDNSQAYPPDIIRRYLQLPNNISPRVKNLAISLTVTRHTNYDKVEALNTHLLTQYPYNFFPPPHPPGAEVVDNFLFVDREGVCEQYATALVVMARAVGIPARLAAGYGAGTYNPITGYYEVHYSDAHSWVEIYFPQTGWVPFDPTPGWNAQPYPTPIQTWLFSDNGQMLKQLTGLDLPLHQMASGALAGLTFFVPFLVGSALVVGLVLLLYYLGRYLYRRRQARRRERYSSLGNDDTTRRRILALYRQGLRLLPRRRYPPRAPTETIAEHARRVGPFSALTHLSRLAELAAYRPAPPEADAVEQARRSVQELRQQLNADHKKT
jgi:hypothetical protein